MGHPVLKVQYTRAIDRLSNLMIFAQSTNANLMCASHLDEFECGLSLGALGGDDVDGVAVDEAVAEEADPVALAQPQRHARQHRRRHLRHLVVQPEPISDLQGELVHFSQGVKGSGINRLK